MGRVAGTLSKGEPIWGLTTLDSHLYVLRGNKSTEQIEVYKLDSCRLLRCFTVRGLDTPQDIVACGHNRCAYISDASHRSLHRIALPIGGPITQWPVNDQPNCLSLTVRYSVLVTCLKVRKLKEFTTDGQLIREIVLSQEVLSPWHAVQLSSGEFIVCHGNPDDPLHRVCLIGSDGQVVKSHGGQPGSGSLEMNVPVHMAVDGNGFVFVADVNNCRVSLLSPTLTYLREVVSREQFQWKNRRLSLDVKRRRLYVAESEHKDGKYTAGRVIIVSV